jgi:8-oxo-dGTP pyrophosphatase MutT (NUDIX family)
MKPTKLRVISICCFMYNNSILVFNGFDSVRNKPYYRPLGGGVEPGETTRVTLEREIREELGQEITDVHLLGVIENLFVCEGQAGHEIVFVYDARFVDEAVYRKRELVMQEEKETVKASWRKLDSFDDYHRLVPEDLITLLKKQG